MRTPASLMAIFLLCLTASCNKALDMPGKGKNKIVLLGELTAGDSIHLRIGQSIVISTGDTSGILLPENLEASVSELPGNTYTLSGATDVLAYGLQTLLFTSPQQPGQGRLYAVRARQASLPDAEAQVRIPDSFSARVVDTLSTQYADEPAAQFDIAISDLAGAKGYYVIEAIQPDPYGVPGAYKPVLLYTNDRATENLISGDSLMLTRRVFMTDSTFEGQTHAFKIFLPYTGIDRQRGGGTEVRLMVKSVSEDYFRFLIAYDQYDPTSVYSVNTTQLVLKGNVSNGFGMVGGVYKHEFVYTY